MFSNRIAGLSYQKSLLIPKIVLAHSMTCPERKKAVCPGSKSGARRSPPGSGGGDATKLPNFKRAEKSGPVRFGFLPDEWFLFFYPHTGVSGPYVFGLVLINYWLSKEIYIMEHEYYLGLSVGIVTYYAVTTFGPDIGKSFDEEVDAIEKGWEKGRKDEINMYETAIKEAEAAQMRANGQKNLMDAKKENIAMQLEAAYRERLMQVYQATKGRLDYQSKKYRTEAKVYQKWMVQWILENVRKAITPEFEQQALDAAIRDLSTAAGKA